MNARYHQQGEEVFGPWFAQAPDDTAITPDVRLELLGRADQGRVANFYAENYAHLQSAGPLPPVTELEDRLSDMLNSFANSAQRGVGAMYGVTVPEQTNEKLHGVVQYRSRNADGALLGYMGAAERPRQVIMSEAVGTLLVQLADSGMPRLFAPIAADNQPSQSLVAQVGGVLDTTLNPADYQAPPDHQIWTLTLGGSETTHA